MENCFLHLVVVWTVWFENRRGTTRSLHRIFVPPYAMKNKKEKENTAIRLMVEDIEWERKRNLSRGRR